MKTFKKWGVANYEEGETSISLEKTDKTYVHVNKTWYERDINVIQIIKNFISTFSRLSTKSPNYESLDKIVNIDKKKFFFG